MYIEEAVELKNNLSLFFFNQTTTNEFRLSLVGSVMYIRDRLELDYVSVN